MRRIAAVLALCVLPGTSNAASEDSFKLYSDICYNVEGGDALGIRIGVVKLSEATYAFLQRSVGEPNKNPEMTQVSAEDLRHGKLVFSVPRFGELATFRGTITAKGLTGGFTPKLPGEPKTYRLRKVSPQQRFADCK